MGDQLSPAVLDIADDLYHLRVPKQWCKLAGNTAPPSNYALGTWLTDLANRCQHFERILVLVSLSFSLMITSLLLGKQSQVIENNNLH